MARRLDPWRLFFPSAFLLAPLNVLLWLALRQGVVDWPVSVSAGWHGREMVFGYAYAVIAGYLLSSMAAWRVGLLWLLWLAGRLLWLAPAGSLDPRVEVLAAALFPVAVAALGVLRFHGVKRMRNAAFPAIMVALGCAAAGSYAAELGLLPAPGQRTAVLAVYVASLLIVVMGGRAVPTATVGALRARGEIVRIEPDARLEAAAIAGLLALVVLDALGREAHAGAVAVAVALVLAARLRSWRPAAVLHDPEVWPLHAGYAWLALGLLLIGLERLGLAHPADAGALHALAAGGIGTVTLAMVLRVARQRGGPAVAPVGRLQALQAVMALAVALRVAGGWLPGAGRTAALWLAAAGWALAFALAAGLLAAAVRAPAAAESP